MTKALLQNILDGLAVGSIYALIALGYTLVYGIIRLINFAHGEFYMIGAYAGLFVLSGPWAATTSPALFGAVLLAAIAASSLSAALLAVATERIAYRPIRSYSRVSALLTAIGVSFFLQSAARLLFTPNPRTYGPAQAGPESCWRRFLDWYKDYSHPLGFELQNAKILFLAITLLAMAGLYILVMKTRMGKAMRATSQDLEAAKLMGIDTDAVIAKTFALGGFFAGLTGILMGMLYTVEPLMGFRPGLKAFVAAVVGGIGSIPGAVAGGFVIGLAENIVSYVQPDTPYRDAVAFVLLVLILLFRPSGILGKTRREKV